MIIKFNDVLVDHRNTGNESLEDLYIFKEYIICIIFIKSKDELIFQIEYDENVDNEIIRLPKAFRCSDLSRLNEIATYLNNILSEFYKIEEFVGDATHKLTFIRTDKITGFELPKGGYFYKYIFLTNGSHLIISDDNKFKELIRKLELSNLGDSYVSKI